MHPVAAKGSAAHGKGCTIATHATYTWTEATVCGCQDAAWLNINGVPEPQCKSLTENLACSCHGEVICRYDIRHEHI